jgi:N-acetylglucosamine-6-phosphate deacetylase
MENKSLLIKNVNIYLEDEKINRGKLLISQGKISGIFTEEEQPTSYPSHFKILDAEG